MLWYSVRVRQWWCEGRQTSGAGGLLSEKGGLGRPKASRLIMNPLLHGGMYSQNVMEKVAN